MKFRIIAAVLQLCLLLTGCALAGMPPETAPQPEAETMTCLIPNSYFKFTGTDAQEDAQALNELGPEYCTSAVFTEEGVEVELTEVQQEHMIARNNRTISQYFETFTAADSSYTYEADPEYRKLTLFFDEKIPMLPEINAVFGTAAGYCLNQILLNQADWGVEVTIYNCHTKKAVVSMNLPEDEGSFGPEEWKASYEP